MELSIHLAENEGKFFNNPIATYSNLPYNGAESLILIL
jgi:hypothetical protein